MPNIEKEQLATGRGQIAVSPPITRIRAVEIAARILFSRDIQRATRLLQIPVHLLPLISGPRLSQRDQQYNLSVFPGLAGRVASASLASGNDSFQALELLEVGRGIITSFP